MRISVLVMPMNSAAGTPLPQTSPTPSAIAPVGELHQIEEVAADVPRRRHRGKDVEAGFGGEFGDLRQQRALNDRRARHFVVALAAQDDLLGHAAESLSEIGEVGNRIAQLHEQRRVELMPLERGERVGIEADRAVDPAHPLAHPADDVDQQGGRGARDFEERSASEAQGGHGRARAHRRAAGQMRQRAHSPTSEGARRVEIGIAPRALSAATITSPSRISMA